MPEIRLDVGSRFVCYFLSYWAAVEDTHQMFPTSFFIFHLLFPRSLTLPQYAYYLCRIEPHITVSSVMLSKGRKSESDKKMIDSLSRLCSKLRSVYRFTADAR